jgi:hypothetical protein
LDPLGGPFARVFSVRESNADASATDHGTGPGLEVAMTFRWLRPIRISLFAQVYACNSLLSLVRNGIDGEVSCYLHIRETV